MSRETEFTVFCIENYKVHKSLTGKQTVELFRQYGVIDYLKEFYDVLHTMGDQYIPVRLPGLESRLLHSRKSLILKAFSGFFMPLFQQPKTVMKSIRN